MADGEKLARIAGSHWWSGTNEIRLARAARASDCELTLIRTRTPEKARKELAGYLKRNIPIILCVDDWQHWITVLAAEADKLVVVDSNLDPVLQVIPWSKLRLRWRYLDRDYHSEEPPELYEGYALVPKFRVSMRGKFSVDRVQHLRRTDNQNLALHWDVYLEDLLAICRPRNARHDNPLSMAEFLRRNQELIVSRVMFWHGDASRRELLRLIRSFRFVAETYGLVIPKDAARRAVADMAILTAMWVVARRGIGPMYGDNAE